MSAFTTLATFATVTAAALALGGCGKPEAINENNEQAGTTDPANPAGRPIAQNWEVDGPSNFAELINKYPQAKSSPTPWAGYWFPYTKNGIAENFGGGSPAGKYDAARGGTTRAQQWEVDNHGAKVKGVQGWWGHCNGWTAAATLFPEPKKDVKINGITFSIADQKALLTEAAMEASADFFGDRVEAWAPNSHVNDTAPGQLFLVLTNYIGRRKQGVGIDRYTAEQVWNQALTGYRIDYPKKEDYLGEAPGAPGVYRINVNMKLWWAEDAVSPMGQTPEFNYEETDRATDGHGNLVFSSRELRAELWLDGPVEFDPVTKKITKSGNIIVTRKENEVVSGEWKMGYHSDAWPDYTWVPYSVLDPTDYKNPHIDMKWLEKHMLSGGVDDPSVRPSAVPTAPTPSSRPSDRPTPTPTMTNTPRPTPTSPFPFPTPTTTPPRPTPTGTGRPFPWPF